MPRDMFGDIVEPSIKVGSQKWYTVPVSIVVHTTIIAAVSFLLHFMLLGAVYSDWLDPVSDDDVSVAGLIDSLKNLPAPPAIEDKLDIKPDENLLGVREIADKSSQR